MKLLRAALLFWLFAAPCFAAPVPDTFADPAMETRARALQRELRCLVCMGESIDESGSPLAADLRHLVRQQMAAGQSNAQIKDYLVSTEKQAAWNWLCSLPWTWILGLIALSLLTFVVMAMILNMLKKYIPAMLASAVIMMTGACFLWPKPVAQPPVVAKVVPNSNAAESGVQAGDVIVRVGTDAVKTPADAVAKIHAAEKDKKEAVPLLVSRDGTTYYLALQLVNS